MPHTADATFDIDVQTIAVDDGYAQTKLFTVRNGEPVKTVIRTSARSGRYGLGSISGDAAVGCYETEEGEQFTISPNIESENTQFDGFHTSPMNRALVNHALIVGGYAGANVNLIAGLPVADFFIDGGKDEAKIAAKVANLRKRVTPGNAKTPAPNLVNIQIGCQAVAAFVDYVLDDNLNEVVDLNSSIAVVDIGGRTTDVAVVIGGNSIDASRSGTNNIGVLDVYKGVQAAIRAKFGTKDTFPLDLLDKAVRTGVIKLWNEDNDISAEVATIVAEHQAQIAREVERRISSASNLNAVLFVGGGSALFTGISTHFRNGVMHKDPEFANARGLYKFNRYSAKNA